MKTAEQRFWAKVARAASEQCWEWTAGKNKQRYGIFVVRPRLAMTAPRFSLELATGQTGVGLYACHRCDNPGCVNPAHLFWGTQADNMLDARTKGRTRGAPKLTHCRRGHEYTPETTLMVRDGERLERQCKVCNRERALRRYHKDIVKSRAAQNERNRQRKAQAEGLIP